MAQPRISLEQWRALQAVVESGGYAQAAESLHKSQSTLTYAVQKIERLLGVKIFEIRGRKAVLTQSGQVLYRRARGLLEDAASLERGAAEMARDWQPEIRIAAEILFPTWLLLECLAEFARERPETRIEVYETVLTGTDEMLAQGAVDIAIASRAGGGMGAPLMSVRGIPVAHPAHALHRLGRPLTERDLRRHRRILIRDTGTQRQREVEGVELRWTVSNKATSIRALSMGLGFAYLPEDWIAQELASGTLRPLPMQGGAQRSGELHLALADPEFAGRDVLRLAEIIRTRTAERCRAAKVKPRPGGRDRARGRRDASG
jgi:DNA-binding transcriptional LysR family regulator